MGLETERCSLGLAGLNGHMKDFPMRHALSIAAPNPSFTLAPGGDIVTIESIASQEATQDRELRNPTGNHDSAGLAIASIISSWCLRRDEQRSALGRRHRVLS